MRASIAIPVRVRRSLQGSEGTAHRFAPMAAVVLSGTDDLLKGGRMVDSLR